MPPACGFQPGWGGLSSHSQIKGGRRNIYWPGKKCQERFWGHKRTLQTKREEGKTTLSTHFWKEIEAGGAPTIQWRVVESNIPLFNPVTKTCRLCIREKFNIVLNPHLASLNSRQEMFAHCRHMRAKLIGKPPD